MHTEVAIKLAALTRVKDHVIKELNCPHKPFELHFIDQIENKVTMT